MDGSKLATGGAVKATVARRPDEVKTDDARLSASVVLVGAGKDDAVEVRTSPLACCVWSVDLKKRTTLPPTLDW
jgi:azurin